MFGSAVLQQAINFVMWKHCTRAIARDDSIDTELEVTIYINYINKQQSIQQYSDSPPLQQNALAAVVAVAHVAQSRSFNPVLANKDYLTLVITCPREILNLECGVPIILPISFLPIRVYVITNIFRYIFMATSPGMLLNDFN